MDFLHVKQHKWYHTQKNSSYCYCFGRVLQTNDEYINELFSSMNMILFTAGKSHLIRIYYLVDAAYSEIFISLK